jgi:hypothetical protein
MGSPWVSGKGKVLGGKNDDGRMLNFYGLGLQRSAKFNLHLALACCHGGFAQG